MRVPSAAYWFRREFWFNVKERTFYKLIVGTAIAEAALLAWIRRLHEALADWEERATVLMLAAPVLHADETSIRIDGKNHWLHSCSTGDLTLLFC